MFKCYCENTEAHPSINRFMSLVNETVGDGILDFKHLQTAPFMAFWPNLCIIEYVEDKDDYRFRLWGTGLSRFFEADPTNKLLSEVYQDGKYKNFKELHTNAIETSQMICSSGTLEWMNRDHKMWHQITMPLQRKDRVYETLSYVLLE